MRFEFSEIDYYVKNHEAKKHTWYQPYCQRSEISPTRQEVVMHLCQELSMYRRYPLWNHDVVTFLFPHHHLITKDVIIMPVVGSEKFFDAKILPHEDEDYLIIDLLNVADYTTSVKEMRYILHNLCHVHLLRYVINNTYEMPQGYYEELEYRFFCEGLTQYLSWNEDVRLYRLSEPRYLTRRKEAFRSLTAAVHVEGEKIQTQILQLMNRLDLWQRFPEIAGMFYCEYLFQTEGVRLLKDYVMDGYDGVLDAMLEKESEEESESEEGKDE